MTVVLLFIGSFLLMELVSYASHRWVMHGFGMAWHRSHHAPPKGRFERNDLFPLSFSAVGVLLFAAASLGVPVESVSRDELDRKAAYGASVR